MHQGIEAPRAAIASVRRDARNTLTAVYENGVEVGRYDYDRNLIRIRRTTQTENIEYVLDDKHVLNELDAAGNSTRRYHYGTKVLAVSEGTGTSYILNDGIGSASDFWSATGTLAKSRQYDAWGGFRNGTAPAAGEAKVAYTGHQYDPETGWVYAKARYYDSGLGVFLSRDSWEGLIGNAPTLHRYAYAHVNPLRYWDPEGNWAWLVPAAIAFILTWESDHNANALAPIAGAALGAPAALPSAATATLAVAANGETAVDAVNVAVAGADAIGNPESPQSWAGFGAAVCDLARGPGIEGDLNTARVASNAGKTPAEPRPVPKQIGPVGDPGGLRQGRPIPQLTEGTPLPPNRVLYTDPEATTYVRPTDTPMEPTQGSVAVTGGVAAQTPGVAPRSTSPADFVSVKDPKSGTSVLVPGSQARMEQGFQGPEALKKIPSKPSTQTAEPGTIYTVPTPKGTVDVRVMQGSQHHPRRAVFSTPGTSSPRTPLGTTPAPDKNLPKPPVQQTREASHYELEP